MLLYIEKLPRWNPIETEGLSPHILISTTRKVKKGMAKGDIDQLCADK